MKSRDWFFQKRIFYKTGALLFLLASLVGVQSAYAAVDASMTLNARSFPLDRAAVLTITVNGARAAEPQIPEVDGLLFHRRGQSTQMNYINGDYSASVSSVFLIEATRVGQFTVPSIQVVTNDETVMTQALSFEVTAPQNSVVQSQGQAGSSSSATKLRSGEADKVAFLRVIPAKEKSYSGEVVPVEIKVYFRDGIKANLNSLPQLQGEGFVLQELAREPEKTREVVNNSRYTVLSWQSVLSGIKEGEHSVSVGLTATLLLPQRQQNSFGNHGLGGDPFFSNFFSSYQEKEVQIACPALKLSVLPLPEKGKPDGFSGAIGDFRLDVTANPVELAFGDPVTLTMTVSGHGNFDRVQAPEMSNQKGWKTYTPSSEFFKDGGPGRGKKVFEQAIVVKDPTLREVPAIQFSYFDPETAAYKTLNSDSVPLEIQGVPVAKTAVLPVEAKKVQKEKSAVSTVETLQNGVPMPTLAPLQLSTGALNKEFSTLFARQWFQVVAGVLLLLLAVVLFFKLRAARYAGNPRLQRDQAMKHLLLLRLKEIDQALLVNDARGFLAACRRAIQEQLGLVWGTESGAITYIDLQVRLSADSPLLTVFRAADESAYGGRELDMKQMKAFAESVKKELEGLV